jgi:hypothetical protein
MSKGPVTVLPVRELFEDLIFFDPLRRTGLDLLDEICQTEGWMQTGQKMDMVIDPIQPVEMALLILDDPPEVTKEISAGCTPAAIHVGPLQGDPFRLTDFVIKVPHDLFKFTTADENGLLGVQPLGCPCFWDAEA